MTLSFSRPLDERVVMLFGSSVTDLKLLDLTGNLISDWEV